MKEKIRKNIKWIIVGILLICFIIIAFFMVTGKIHGFDRYIYNIISKFINPITTNIVKIITNLASPIVIVIITLIVSYILGIRKKDKKTAIMFCLNPCIITLLNFGIKNIFERTRPELISIIAESGYSFPSGHTSLSMAFYGYIIYLINKKCSNKKVKITGTIIFSILIFLIGLSRVYLGVHYASDVIAAFVLSLSYLIIYTHIVHNVASKKGCLTQ